MKPVDPAGGGIVPTSCKLLEMWCACTASNSDTIPGQTLMPEDEIMVLLRPAPGALPELPGLGEDDNQMAPGPHPGDMDCDGDVDFLDINPFVLALTNPAGYVAAYPDCLLTNADVNMDANVDFLDIGPFVDLLGS